MPTRRTTPLRIAMNSAMTSSDRDDRGDSRRCNAIQLAHQESDEAADQLSDLHEHEQRHDRQHRGERVVVPRQPRHAHRVADVVLPDVKPDDHADGAGYADDHEHQPRALWRSGAAVLGQHEPHQPHRKHAERVADRARGAADQALEQRPAGQQRGRHRQPQEHQPDRGAGERVSTDPPVRPRLRFLGRLLAGFPGGALDCSSASASGASSAGPAAAVSVIPSSSAVGEVRGAFLDKRGHAFGLVVGGERGVEESAFVAAAPPTAAIRTPG